jgi:ABC-type dipeptide/oligopeptide/nickel transport system permease subunit
MATPDLLLDPGPLPERVGRSSAPQRTDLLRFLIRRAPLACVLVLLFVVLALFGPWLEPHDPDKVDLLARLQGSSWSHPLGTDPFGRDTLSRLIAGARVAAEAALIVVLLGGLVGTALGLLAGGLGGKVDLVISRVIEIIQGFPVILLAIALVAVLGPSLFHAMLAAGVGAIPDFARIARGIALQLRHREFVEAARSAGASELRILWTDVLPNMVGSLIVITSFDAAQAVMYESALSFLGLGVRPPTSSYGVMLSEAQGYLTQQPMYAVYVGTALALVILGLNLIGDALSDYFDRGAS